MLSCFGFQSPILVLVIMIFNELGANFSLDLDLAQGLNDFEKRAAGTPTVIKDFTCAPARRDQQAVPAANRAVATPAIALARAPELHRNSFCAVTNRKSAH
jgi:hypothetical protein